MQSHTQETENDKSNKTHPLIAREALMAGIAKMKEWKPEEQKTFTQKVAVEMMAEAARDQMALGRSIGEVVFAMRESICLTLSDATIRSYLQKAKKTKAANDAAAVTTPMKRHGRKDKPVMAATDAGAVDVASKAERAESEHAINAVSETDNPLVDQAQDFGRGRDATVLKVDAKTDDASNENANNIDPIEAFFSQFPDDADLVEEGRG